jgi:hypothetical protein
VATDIAKRQADRLRVLRAIWEVTDGTTSEVARTAPTIQMQLGLSDKELEAACDYLAGEGLPDKPTRHLPSAASVVAVASSTLINWPI